MVRWTLHKLNPQDISPASSKGLRMDLSNRACLLLPIKSNYDQPWGQELNKAQYCVTQHHPLQPLKSHKEGWFYCSLVEGCIVPSHSCHTSSTSANNTFLSHILP
uniref:Uncharacterized protein n=1 Tax=Micrurus lemniscatus lemniscatus TaxID=129467 RepID=A0A2D4H767_MICLE